jgi:hypothetical protein
MFSCKEKKNMENITDVNIIVEPSSPMDEAKVVISQTEFRVNIPKKLFENPEMIKTAVEIENELALQQHLIFVEDNGYLDHYYLLKNYPDSNCDIKFFFRHGSLYSYHYFYNLDKLNIINKHNLLLKAVEQFNNEFGHFFLYYDEYTSGIVSERNNYGWEVLYGLVDLRLHTNPTTGEDSLEVIVYSYNPM